MAKRLQVKYLISMNKLEIISCSFLLLILIKNSSRASYHLYMVSLENPENQNSEIAANTSETGA